MAKNTTYDIVKAFEAIEMELIASMIRNIQNHKLEEIDEKKQWTMWQVEQLKALEQYRRSNEKLFGKEFKQINDNIEMLIRVAKDEGEMDQEIEILKAIKKGYKARKVSQGAAGEFFKLNERKLDALIKATVEDMQKAETAILRMAEDQYRKIIYNAQVYANTGAGTYEKAVDMATKDMLAAGLNCIEYANGARHTLKDYANMAIRTASKRAYLQGEGTKRQEWGIATVIVNKRGNPCPKCLPFCGKVLIDDVWSDGSSDGISSVTGVKYPLMSKAVAAGLYHPNCRDVHTTYFEGVNTPPDDRYTKQELNEIAEKYRREQKLQYAKRQEEKYGRLAEYSLDEENSKKYSLKKRMWSKVANATDTILEHEPIKINQLPKNDRDSILGLLNTAETNVQNVFLKYSDDIVFINEKAIGRGVSKKKGIRVNLKKDRNNSRGAYTTTFHEIGHAIDRAGGYISSSKHFKDSLINDFENVVLAYKKQYNLSRNEVYEEISKNIRKHNQHSISDIIGGITLNKCKGKYSHETEYWKKPHNLEREAFAHFYEAYARNDVHKIKMLSQMFPEATRIFIELLEDMCQR